MNFYFLIQNKMTSFAKQQKRIEFDWNKFLSNKNKTRDEKSISKTLSRSWVTCACGQQCQIIERFHHGEPTDNQLAYLGDIFCTQICDENYELAKKTLKLIEMRSSEIINHIKNIQNKTK